MKYQVGDTVLLLHSNEEGEVKEIMNENMVLVNVDGVEFPVFTDQIDFPYFKRFSEQSKAKKEADKNKKIYVDQIKKEKSSDKVKDAPEGVFLSFVPVYNTQHYEDEILKFKIYLINLNHENYQFEYSAQYKSNAEFVVENKLSSGQDFYLHDITNEELNDLSKFRFLFSLEKPQKEKEEVLEVGLKIKAKTFFQKIDEMHVNNVSSFKFLVFDFYPSKKPEPYFPVNVKYGKPLTGRSSEPPRSVIDIHIEKILDHHFGMDNFQILQTQLAYFEKYFELSVAHMQPKLIVIHGVGTGKLRDEIHEILRHKKEVKSFTNQYHPAFGFGATEIYFQY